MRVSKRFRDLYKTKKGSASTTGGNISWLKKKNEMSEFLIKPNRKLKRDNPYAAQLPKPTASIDEQTETMAEFQKRLRNSSLTVDSIPIVSGDRPRDRHPSHLGVKSIQGIILPFITSGAILNEVVIVQ